LNAKVEDVVQVISAISESWPVEGGVGPGPSGDVVEPAAVPYTAPTEDWSAEAESWAQETNEWGGGGSNWAQ